MAKLDAQTAVTEQPFDYEVDRFADLQILRYQVPGFERLPLKRKLLLYHLSEAALAGRDILFDQHGFYNLLIRRLLEAIYIYYIGDRRSASFRALETYLKRVWFASGIHHHYAEDKFVPEFSAEFLKSCVMSLEPKQLPLYDRMSSGELLDLIVPILFDSKVMPKRTDQSGDRDHVQHSSVNFYGPGLSETEVNRFYEQLKTADDETPVSFGLNSRLVKENGSLKEMVWKADGMYSAAIVKIVEELKAAESYADDEDQKNVIAQLVSFYQSGDLDAFDRYSISWVKDTASKDDFVNGFIETYSDPLGRKGSWESTVYYVDEEATKRTRLIAGEAQWFEDHSPVDPSFRKSQVKGISARAITMVMLGGDCYPATPIGINLPNSEWIRRDYGSKSVTIENITEAYDKASAGNGFMEEFIGSDKERDLLKRYGYITDNLHTDLHECLGHGSGQLLPGVQQDALGAYGSTLEEARADLFGLYYLADSKMLQLGLLPDAEAYKAGYYKYMMNGLLTQLVRIEKGKDLEEAHMRNRQLIARWVYEKGLKDEVVVIVRKEGKSFVVINDYEALRRLFGALLGEVQRIKSEGDYEAGKNLVEKYGTIVDKALRDEMAERYESLHLAPYKGFVNPRMELKKNAKDEIVDVTLDYTEGYAEQMLRYSRDYSFLPTINA